ncbi:MAG: serpin family protein [Candidatus Stygibacter australis]|nr:serpin family protein [Candidatus Stygibacter australis]MDP8323504.1 serpin family protein [Candidatus Stygibacter australis]
MKTTTGFLIILLFATLMINANDISDPINDFGFDLLRQIDAEDNIVISPYSVFTALAMTAEGADKETLSQMRSVLKLDKNITTAESLGALQNYLLTQSGDNVELKIANALWMANNYKIRESFINKIEIDYQAELHQSDFYDQKMVLQEINQWVAGKTNDKIPEILQYLNPASKLVLLNAIYFKAKWQHKFNPRFTKKEDFHLNSNEIIKADMMHITKRFNYYEDDILQAVRMRYDDSDYSMLILLPKESSQLPDALGKLNKEYYNEINSNWITGKSVIVALPKFKIDYSRMLNDDLIAMGMPVAFTSEADFSRINEMMDLEIGQVQHRGFIDVDETGSEAAAATAVTMKLNSAGPPKDQYEFTADHPFIFLLQENTHNLILFAGIVSNPE